MGDAAGTRHNAGRDLSDIMLNLLEQQAEEFRQAACLKDQLVPHLSQAGRASLTLILGSLERLLNGAFGNVPSQLREQLVLMHRNARKLLQDIEQVDEIVLLEAGQMQLDVRRQDLIGFLRRLTQCFQRQARRDQIDLRFKTELEQLNLLFCADAFNKVFSQLIAFALKRTLPGGAVCVAVEPEGLFPDAYATVTISDTGMRIAAARLPGRFDGFSQTGSESGKEGMDLGLLFARNLAMRYGNGFSVASEPGHGAVIRVLLPLGNAPATEPDDARAGVPPPSDVEALPGPVKVSLFDGLRDRAEAPEPELHDRKTIFLVNGSGDMRAYLRSCLGTYRIVEAVEGAQALRMIRKQQPDLIVCDLVLPGLGGAELLRALKADPRFADIPFILTTNRVSEEQKVQMLEAGAAAYLIEPFRAAELQVRVHNLLAMEEREKKTQALVHQAELEMLRYQLNPHFLFNALNAIRALIISDAARSRELVTALSEYLRYSLRTANDLEVSLQEELTSVRSYLDIEKIRFEEDLDVCFEIHPDATGCTVPGVLLQPLVENAVKYGMETSAMPLRIRILGSIQDRRLHLEVANTGQWLAPDEAPGSSTGIGLRNLRLRLDQFYPARHRFDVAEQDGWVKAILDIDLA